MLIRFFGDFNPARKKRTSPPADTVTGIQHRKGQGLLIRQALMPAQPEFFLTAQAVDIAGFGEVGRFQRWSRWILKEDGLLLEALSRKPIISQIIPELICNLNTLLCRKISDLKRPYVRGNAIFRIYPDIDCEVR